MEHQEQSTEQQPIMLILFPQVMHLPLTDKRKIILSTLLSIQKHLVKEPIYYQGEVFNFHFKQREIFQILNYPKNTFEYNMRWLRNNGYLNYRRGCIPGSNQQTTYFNVKLVQWDKEK
jgi:hypothetical protein